MTSERSKRRNFLSLIFIAKLIRDSRYFPTLALKVSKAEYPHGAESGLLSDDKSCCLLLRSSWGFSNLFNEMDENKNGN